MKNADLVARLLALPADADVAFMYDGHVRIPDFGVWHAQSGDIMLGGLGDPVYDDRNRMVGAPTEKQSQYLAIHEMLGLPAPRDEDDAD